MSRHGWAVVLEDGERFEFPGVNREDARQAVVARLRRNKRLPRGSSIEPLAGRVEVAVANDYPDGASYSVRETRCADSPVTFAVVCEDTGKVRGTRASREVAEAAAKAWSKGYNLERRRKLEANANGRSR